MFFASNILTVYTISQSRIPCEKIEGNATEGERRNRCFGENGSYG
jgi:hypothetical protein